MGKMISTAQWITVKAFPQKTNFSDIKSSTKASSYFTNQSTVRKNSTRIQTEANDQTSKSPQFRNMGHMKNVVSYGYISKFHK